MKVMNIIDFTLIALGTAYSIDNIKTLLGLIIICINLVWLLVKFIIKVKHYYDSSNNFTEESVDEFIGDFDELIDKVDELNNCFSNNSTEESVDKVIDNFDELIDKVGELDNDTKK